MVDYIQNIGLVVLAGLAFHYWTKCEETKVFLESLMVSLSKCILQPDPFDGLEKDAFVRLLPSRDNMVFVDLNDFEKSKHFWLSSASAFSARICELTQYQSTLGGRAHFDWKSQENLAHYLHRYATTVAWSNYR